MAGEFKLSVVAPDRTVFEDTVRSVIAPGVTGYLGIMANHEPAIIALKTGIVEYVDSRDQRSHVAITGGFLEVSEGQAIILADGAERSTEIDIKKAEEALESARRALRGDESGMTTSEATAEIDRAMNRIKAAKR